MDMNLARSAKSAIQASGSDMHVVENFPLSMQVLRDGLKKVWKRDFETPHQGMNFMSEGTMDQPTEKYQTFRSVGGIVGQNRDGDDMEFVTRADGFGFEVNSYPYRQGIKVERELMEIDNVGVVRGLQMDLAENAKMTLEYAIADCFNRSVYTGSGDRFPLLADDGHPLIDSGRPNANPAAGTWGNKEADSAITPTSLWTAQLNARATTDENGELFPRKIMKIVIRPEDEKTLQEILSSEKNPLNANNTYNTMYKKFDYEVYDYLTAARIFYMLENPKSERNELRFYWRQKPTFLTWQGDNPDVIQQRVRFIFGLGLGSPRRVWRGGVVL